MSERVAIDEVRVGMFIQLDSSWLEHPFARSAFRVETPQQLAQLRALPLKSVRWDPARSHLRATAALLTAAGDDDLPSDPMPLMAVPPSAPRHRRAPPALPAEAALRLQREAIRQSAQHYAAGCQGWRRMQAQLAQAPEAARGAAEALNAELLQHVNRSGPVCLRLLDAVPNDAEAAHAMNVAVLSLSTARSFGLPADALAPFGLGALLHDIGKAALPERVRHAHPDHTPAERNAYRSHVGLGVTMALRMGLGEEVVQVIAQHHEHASGGGFPAGLTADRMTLAARVVALVNRFDRLCNPAERGRAMTPHEALSMLFTQQRGQVDPALLNAFIRLMSVYPAGSLVQLTDDRWGRVMAINAARPMKPRVLPFEPGREPDEVVHLDLAEHADLGIRRSVRQADLPAEVRDWLMPRQGAVAYFVEAAPESEGAHREAA